MGEVVRRAAGNRLVWHTPRRPPWATPGRPRTRVRALSHPASTFNTASCSVNGREELWPLGPAEGADARESRLVCSQLMRAAPRPESAIQAMQRGARSAPSTEEQAPAALHEVQLRSTKKPAGRAPQNETNDPECSSFFLFASLTTLHKSHKCRRFPRIDPWIRKAFVCSRESATSLAFRDTSGTCRK